MKALIDKWIKKSKSKKGAYSVITVMLVLILALSFTAYTDILTKSYTLNEVQQRLDTAGLNTLNASIDTERLVLEELALDENNRVGKNSRLTTNFENKIKRNYEREVYNQLRANGKLKSIQVRRVDVTMESSNFGTGSNRETAPQITLSSIVYIEVAQSSSFDLGGTNTKAFYDARSGNDISYEIVDREKDGVTGLLVRSSTRVIYR